MSADRQDTSGATEADPRPGELGAPQKQAAGAPPAQPKARGRQPAHAMRVTRTYAEPSYAAPVVKAAIAAFERDEPGPLQPLVVVVAALNEADNLGSLLEEIPDRIEGVPLDVLVIDDGSTDATSEVARQYGAKVLRLTRNCGHGVALRTGYRVARERGGQFIATLDADGQWNPADLPAMLRLVLDDQADLVVGSRALGSTMNTDGVRNLGVKVFAQLASALTGTKVTDTSSGLRLMRVDVPATVRQTQAQYQTSELLVGAIMSGWRVAEVPTIMRPRLSGESRKGKNLFYGTRYARVLMGTWWRESRDAAGIRQERPTFLTRLARYAIGSIVTVGVAAVSLVALVYVGLPGWAASLAASGIAIIPGYPLNRAWAFGRRGRNTTWREVLPYWITSVVVTALAAAAAVGWTDNWAQTLTAHHHHLVRSLIDVVTYLVVYGFLWVGRFAVFDRVLFRPDRNGASASDRVLSETTPGRS